MAFGCMEICHESRSFFFRAKKETPWDSRSALVEVLIRYFRSGCGANGSIFSMVDFWTSPWFFAQQWIPWICLFFLNRKMQNRFDKPFSWWDLSFLHRFGACCWVNIQWRMKNFERWRSDPYQLVLMNVTCVVSPYHPFRPRFHRESQDRQYLYISNGNIYIWNIYI